MQVWFGDGGGSRRKKMEGRRFWGRFWWEWKEEVIWRRMVGFWGFLVEVWDFWLEVEDKWDLYVLAEVA